MKNFIYILLSFLIATPLVFAEHTKASSFKSVATVKNQERILKKLDRKIKRAERRNESIDESIATITKRYKRHRRRQIRKTKRLLGNQRKFEKAFNEVQLENPELTKDEFRSSLTYSLSQSYEDRQLADIEDRLLKAGSMVNFLKDAKTNIQNPDIAQQEVGNTWGIILLIVFVGTPILAILAAIIVLILGMFTLALGLTIYAVVVAGVLVLISNIGKDKRMQLPPSKRHNPINDNYVY